MAQQCNKNSKYVNPHEVTPDKPFHIAFLREITDQYDAGEISYGKMVEMLNEVAMKWYEQKRLLIEIMEADEKDGLYQPTISKMETIQTPKEKVTELINKFISAGFLPFVAEIGTEIVIDEILREHMFDDSDYANRRHKYWQEVKQNL